MLVPKEIIREIKDRLDIVDIIREYVTSLKKSGKNWVCLCPFHNDRNPSLHISSDIGIFKCFSCGEGGDVIGFVQKIENITFTEALKILAKRAGVKIDFSSEQLEKKHQKKEELILFNDRLIKLFQYFLLENEEGRFAFEYLKNRGIDQGLIETFKIGYAPKGYDRLPQFFLKKGFTEEFLVSTGIISRNEKGLRPLFFDRIVFPIINHNEECIGFGARALSNEIKPKYINTPETMLYKKSYSLYGINAAKNFIRNNKKVYVVEGYMDLISCYKNGLKNVVAPCGTAVTSGQITLLGRYAEEIVFLMDGDDAGKKGAEKALWESANTLLKKRVMMLPDGMDPDDYFKENCMDDFKLLEEKSADAFDFFVKNKVNNIDKKDYAKLTSVLNSIFEYINIIENEIVKNSLLQRLAELLELNEGVIARAFASYGEKNKYAEKKSSDADIETEKIVLDDLLKKEIDLILLLLKLNFKESGEVIKQCSIRENHFYNELTKKAFIFYHDKKKIANMKDFIDEIDDNGIRSYIEERLFSDEFKQPEVSIRNNIIDRIINILDEYYERLNNNQNDKLDHAKLYCESNDDIIKSILEEKNIIANERTKLPKLRELKRNA